MSLRRIALALAVLVVTAVPVAAGAEDDPSADGPAITFPDEPRSLQERAALVMDHESLGPLLRSEGFRWASNAEIYLAEIVPGAGGPALVTFDAVQGAFSQNFWPASSVKLLAAVAALEYAGSLGFTGDAVVTGSSFGGRTIRSIYEPAILHSDNRSYDLLVRLAGLDFINLEFLPEHRFDTATIGTAFTDLSVRVSPSFSLSQWTAAGLPFPIPSYLMRRLQEADVPRRPASRYYRSNNLDLFDLGEVVRRVMLHDELDPGERFDLDRSDVAALQAALCAAEPAHYQAGAIEEWGEDVEVCGKSGWWERTAEPEEEAGDDEEPAALPPSCTDVALISDPDTGRRVLLGATGGCFGSGLGGLSGPALRAVAALPAGTPLQPDGGLAIEVTLTPLEEGLEVRIDTGAFGVQVRVDRGSPVPAGRDGDGFSTVLPMPAAGPHLLVIEGLSFGVKVAYRAVDFDVAG